MIHFIIGAVTVLGFFLLINFTTKKNLHIKWWGWIIVVLGFVYCIFVMEVIVAFLEEGVARGAFVIGLLLGIIAIIWGVLTSRFIFRLNRN